MKLELKNIKHSEWASEETHCYQASLYVDGKPLAIVGNAGHGGGDRDYAHPKFNDEFSVYCDKMLAVHAYFKALPKTPSEWCADGLPQELEYWCADQVNDWLSARKLKKHLKKSYVYHLADGAGVYAHESRPASTVAVVLNDLPFADALAIWKETA